MIDDAAEPYNFYSHPSGEDTELYGLIKWRSDDVVIAGWLKCGTNWMQNIVHQVLTGGDDSFDFIKEEVPYIGWWKGIRSFTLKHLEAMASPRAMKTHNAAYDVVLQPQVKYIVCARDVMDVPESLLKFVQNLDDQAIQSWGGHEIIAKDIDELAENLDDFVPCVDMYSSWLKHRDDANVLCIHFADMKRDLTGVIRKIADFVGADLSNPETFDRVLNFSGFQWMKENEDKFERMPDGTRQSKPGTHVRQGDVGSNKATLPQHIVERLNKVCHDRLSTAEREWLSNGGELPPLGTSK